MFFYAENLLNLERNIVNYRHLLVELCTFDNSRSFVHLESAVCDKAVVFAVFRVVRTDYQGIVVLVHALQFVDFHILGCKRGDAVWNLVPEACLFVVEAGCKFLGIGSVKHDRQVVFVFLLGNTDGHSDLTAHARVHLEADQNSPAFLCHRDRALGNVNLQFKLLVAVLLLDRLNKLLLHDSLLVSLGYLIAHEVVLGHLLLGGVGLVLLLRGRILIASSWSHVCSCPAWRLASVLVLGA